MVCLNSQTAAAETSLRILGIGEGDEVITCAYTYTASALMSDPQFPSFAVSPHIDI